MKHTKDLQQHKNRAKTKPPVIVSSSKTKGVEILDLTDLPKRFKDCKSYLEVFMCFYADPEGKKLRQETEGGVADPYAPRR